MKRTSLTLSLLLLFATNAWADYQRVGPVNAEICYFLGCFLFSWEEVDSVEINGRFFQFPTYFKEGEIDVSNSTRCWTSSYNGRKVYFQGKELGKANDIVFKCRKY